MKTAQWLLPTLVMLCLSPAACGGEDEDDGGRGAPDSGPAVSELPPLLAEALCGSMQECMGPLLGMFLGGADCEQTVALQLSEGDFGLLQTAVDEGTVEYHPERVQDCLDEIAALGCGIAGSWYSETCEAALTGTVAEGGDCLIDPECAGDRFCRIEDACPGSCAARGSAGDACEEDDQCDRGLSCARAQEGGPGQCVALMAEGHSCLEPLQPCAAGMLCGGQDQEGGTPGNCVAIGDVFVSAEGDACDFITGFELCQDGLHCRLELEPAGPVMTCTGEQAPSRGACAFAIPDLCSEGEYCSGLDLAAPVPVVEGTCAPLPEAGQPCVIGVFGHSGCATDHACIGGTCFAMRQIGGTCQADDQCYSDNCDPTGVCAQHDPCDP